MTTPKDKDIEAAEKLERCRFCGKEAAIEYLSDPFERATTRIDINMAKVRCVDLNCISNSGYTTREKAIAAWNDMSKAATAQALAAAREDGRRGMRDECLKDLDHHMKHQDGPNSYWGKQALHDLRLEIEGIPTNAPEGESDGWNFNMDEAPRDGTNILAYFPLEGLSDDWCRAVPVYWSKRDRCWNFASRAASGFSKEYQPTAWKPLTLPTKEQ